MTARNGKNDGREKGDRRRDPSRIARTVHDVEVSDLGSVQFRSSDFCGKWRYLKVIANRLGKYDYHAINDSEAMNRRANPDAILTTESQFRCDYVSGDFPNNDEVPSCIASIGNTRCTLVKMNFLIAAERSWTRPDAARRR